MAKESPSHNVSPRTTRVLDQSKLADLVELLHSATFSLQEAEESLSALKAAGAGEKVVPDAALQARKALSTLLQQAFRFTDLHKDLERLTQTVHALTDAQSRVVDGTLREALNGCQELSKEVHDLKDVQAKLLDCNMTNLLNDLLPHGEFRRRYLQDHPTEKDALATRVADSFFPRIERCFVHGSTTAAYLGRHLVNRNFRAGSLLYTNSAVFPLTMLRHDALYSVYTFCGSTYDPVCAAWLFPPSDTDTAGHLRDLFTRGHGDLTAALITPFAVAPSGTYYMRPDTAAFCQILLEQAKEVVLMATIDRIHLVDEEVTGVPNAPSGDQIGGLAKLRKPVSLIIGGSSNRLEEYGEFYRRLGVTVHLQDPTSLAWTVREPSGK